LWQKAKIKEEKCSLSPCEVPGPAEEAVKWLIEWFEVARLQQSGCWVPRPTLLLPAAGASITRVGRANGENVEGLSSFRYTYLDPEMERAFPFYGTAHRCVVANLFVRMSREKSAKMYGADARTPEPRLAGPDSETTP
jgi:hypothetical protein